MTQLIEDMDDYCKESDIRFSITDGKTTKETRNRFGLDKKHYMDAYCISISNKIISVVPENIQLPDNVYAMRRFKKKSGGIISKMNDREYWHDGRCVAKNRHKREDQKVDSLEEYMDTYRLNHTEVECARHFHGLEVKPCRRTYTFHKDGRVAPIHAGDIVKYKKCNKTKNGVDAAVFVADKIRMSSGTASCGTKSKSLKYCTRLQSGCIQFV